MDAQEQAPVAEEILAHVFLPLLFSAIATVMGQANALLRIALPANALALSRQIAFLLTDAQEQ
jgi:hypothetical protein